MQSPYQNPQPNQNQNDSPGFRQMPPAQPPYPGATPGSPMPRYRRGANAPRNWIPVALVVGGVIIFALAVIIFIGMVMAFTGEQTEKTIPEGVTVGELALGGMTAEEAQNYLTNSLPYQYFTATDGSRSWLIEPFSLGVELQVAYTVEDMMNAAPNTAVRPEYTIDLTRTMEGLIFLNNQATIPAVGGATPQNGRTIDIPVVLDRLRVDVNGELADGIFELAMIEVEPPPEPEAATSLAGYTASIDASSYSGPTTIHVVERGQELGLIAKEYNVAIGDILVLNPDILNPDILLIGQEIIVPAAGIYQPTAAEAPAPSTNSGKAIVVDTNTQRIYAYENGVLIHSHIASTGLPDTPTVKGDYKIYVKYRADDMQGDDYFLPAVPYTMYFYQGYAIHGTYWHNSFGRPMSHGCVNLPNNEAEWFFNWAEVGTPVRVV